MSDGQRDEQKQGETDHYIELAKQGPMASNKETKTVE